MHPDTAHLQVDATLALDQARRGDRRALAATLGPRRTSLLCDALARHALAKARARDTADNVQTLAGIEQMHASAAEQVRRTLPCSSLAWQASLAWCCTDLFEPRSGANELAICQDAAIACSSADEVTELMINTVASIYAAALTVPVEA